MRMHGTKLFISAPQNSRNDSESEDSTKKNDEPDFFEKHSEDNFEASRSVSLTKSVAVSI